MNLSIGIELEMTLGGGGSPPAGDWILATGFWDDSGVWDDSAVWID